MRLIVACLAVLVAAAEVRAQTAPAPEPAQTSQPLSLPATICGLPVGVPANLPPEGTGPYTYAILTCFEKQGGVPIIDANTYIFYMEMTRRVSAPSENRWVPYTEETEQAIVGDFKRLWATNFLDDLLEVLKNRSGGPRPESGARRMSLFDAKSAREPS